MKKILSLVLIFVLSLTFAGITQDVKAAEGDATVYFHINQFDNDYANTGIGIWDGVDWNDWGDKPSTTVMASDDFGAVVQFVIPAAKLLDGALMDEIQLEITKTVTGADDAAKQAGLIAPGNGKVFADITSLKDGSLTELHVYYVEGAEDVYIPTDGMGAIFITYIDPKVAANEDAYEGWNMWTWNNGTGGADAGTDGYEFTMDMTVQGELNGTVYSMPMKLAVLEIGDDADQDTGFIVRTADWAKQCGTDIMIDNSTVRGSGALMYYYQAGSCTLETDGPAYLADITSLFDMNAGNRFLPGTMVMDPMTVKVEMLMPKNPGAYAVSRFKLLDADGVMIPIDMISVAGTENLGTFTSAVTCLATEYYFVLYMNTTLDHSKIGVVGGVQGWDPGTAITSIDDSNGNAVFEACSSDATGGFKVLFDGNDNGFAWGDVEITPSDQSFDMMDGMAGIYYMSVEDVTVEDIATTVNLVGDVEKYVKVFVDTTYAHASLGLVGSFQGWDIGNTLAMTEADTNGYAVFEFIADSNTPEFKLMYDDEEDGTFEWDPADVAVTPGNVALDFSNTDVIVVFIEHDGTTTILPEGTNLTEVDPVDYTYTAGAACGAGENKLTLFVDTPNAHAYIGAVGTINGWNIGGSVTPIGDTASGLAVIEICTVDATGEFKVIYDDEEDGTFEWDPADVALTNGNQSFDFDGATEMAILVSGTDLTDLGLGTFTAAITPVSQVLRYVKIWVDTDKDVTKLGLVGTLNGWDIANVITGAVLDSEGNAYFELATEDEDITFKVLFDEDGVFEWGGETQEVTPADQIFEGIGDGIEIYIRNGEGTVFNMDHQFVGANTMSLNTAMLTITVDAANALVFGEDYTLEYTDVVGVGMDPEIFFSEYIEGSSNNKALEIFNPSNMDMDLTGYMINYYNNGAAEPTKSFDFTGIILASGETYVLCTDTYANQDDCDESQAYADADAVVFYNGDDAIELTKDGVVIDVIGLVGEDPGSNWPVGTGFTNEHTLRRANTVMSGNTVLTGTEWDVFAQDTFDGLGSHSGMVFVEEVVVATEVLMFNNDLNFVDASPVEGMGTYAVTPTGIQVEFDTTMTPLDGSLLFGDSNWAAWYGDQWSGATSSVIEIVDGALTVDVIYEGTPATYATQVYQEGFAVENGNFYRITFEAYADEAKDLIVAFGDALDYDPWFTDYVAKTTFNLTTTMQTFVLEFEMTEATTADQGKLVFELATAVNTMVYIDNVMIEEIDALAGTAVVDSNQVMQGDFETPYYKLILRDENGAVVPFESYGYGNSIGTFETDRRCHSDKDLILIHVRLTNTIIDNLDQLGLVGTINGWDIGNAITAEGMDSNGNYVFEVCVLETDTGGEFKVKYDMDSDGFTWDGTTDPELTPGNVVFSIANGPHYLVEEGATALDVSMTHMITLASGNALDKTKEYTLEFMDENGFIIYIPVDMDNQAPVVDYAIIPDVEFTVYSNDDFDLMDYFTKLQFLDNREGELAYEIVTDIDLTTAGAQTVTIKATDMWMNETTFDIDFMVIAENVLPTITGDAAVTLQANATEPAWADYVTVTGGTLSINDSQVDMTENGVFYIIYTVTNANGNKVTHTLEVTIEGATATNDTGCFGSIGFGSSIVLAIAALGGAVIFFVRKR